MWSAVLFSRLDRNAVSYCPMMVHANDMVKKVAVLANPFSGSGSNREYVGSLVHALKQVDFDVHTVWSIDEYQDFWGRSDLEYGYRCFIVAGGDGSLAGVINAVPDRRLLQMVPLAVLPLGNENLFARQFRFNRDVHSLVQAIIQNRTRMVDLGLAGDRLFTLMVSTGIDADVVHRVARWRQNVSGAGMLKRINRISYLPRILCSVRRYQYPAITVEMGDRHITGSHVFVFNLPRYGGCLAFTDDADGSDSLLDWLVFEKPGVINLACYVWAVMKKRHLDRLDVKHGKTDSIQINAQLPVPVQADGDPIGFTPISVTVQPRALRIIEM